MNMKKGILVPLLSGGVDSAIATLKEKKASGVERLEPIFIDREQKGVDQERKAACTVSNILKATDFYSYHIDFSWYKREKAKESKTIPHGRNLVLAAIAASHAATTHPSCRNIVIVGFNSEDAGMGDTTQDFVKALNQVISHAIGFNEDNSIVIVKAPLIRMKKSEAISWALKNGGEEMLKHTWSCWADPEDNNGLHCGLCDACVKRHFAFQQAMKSDPTKYQHKLKE